MTIATIELTEGQWLTLEFVFTDWLMIYEVVDTERWERLSVFEEELLARHQWQRFREALEKTGQREEKKDDSTSPHEP